MWKQKAGKWRWITVEVIFFRSLQSFQPQHESTSAFQRNFSRYNGGLSHRLLKTTDLFSDNGNSVSSDNSEHLCQGEAGGCCNKRRGHLKRTANTLININANIWAVFPLLEYRVVLLCFCFSWPQTVNEESSDLTSTFGHSWGESLKHHIKSEHNSLTSNP